VIVCDDVTATIDDNTCAHPIDTPHLSASLIVWASNHFLPMNVNDTISLGLNGRHDG
jgi:hypothetical protein